MKYLPAVVVGSFVCIVLFVSIFFGHGPAGSNGPAGSSLPQRDESVFQSNMQKDRSVVVTESNPAWKSILVTSTLRKHNLILRRYTSKEGTSESAKLYLNGKEYIFPQGMSENMIVDRIESIMFLSKTFDK